MKNLLLSVVFVFAANISALGQSPASLAGLTLRHTYQYLGYVASTPGPHVAGLIYGGAEAIDFRSDGTYMIRCNLYEDYADSKVYYLPASTGTYTYVQNTLNNVSNSATLTLSGTAPGAIQLSFSDARSGWTDLSNALPASFTLTPTGGDNSTRSLLNISTLISAKQGSPITVGFVIGGTTQLREILIRAIGPSLAQFGVNNFAANPTYSIHGEGIFKPYVGNVQSVNWSANSITAAMIAAEDVRAGAFSLVLGSNDKADILLLNPGAYTITVNPTDSSGEGAELIEIYEIQ